MRTFVLSVWWAGGSVSVNLGRFPDSAEGYERARRRALRWLESPDRASETCPARGALGSFLTGWAEGFRPGWYWGEDSWGHSASALVEAETD